jgi:hypothetical protein
VVASEKLLTALTTLCASAPIAATCAAGEFDGSALTALTVGTIHYLGTDGYVRSRVCAMLAIMRRGVAGGRGRRRRLLA